MYQEMPKHISRKFFIKNPIVPYEFRYVFMPQVGVKQPIEEIESWLEDSEISFRRKSIYLFLEDELQATLFKLRWC